MHTFYYSKQKIFHSKIEALENDGNVFFYYHDQEYDKLNWNVEPALNIKELYKLNALRIREKYDKLILCYSGGYDSTQVLETFIFNNIKLDKIVTVGAFSQDANSDSDENMNIEAYKNAFPLIKKYNLSEIYEVFDYTKLFDNPSNFMLNEYGHNWIDKVGSYFSLHHFFWHNLEEIIVPNSWRDKKTGIIFGMDKPYLFFDLSNNKFYFSFRDSVINSYGNRYSSLYSDRLFFYWDINFPDILLKQLHTIKNKCLLYHSLSKKPIDVCLHLINDLISTPVLTEDGRNVSLVYDIKNPLSVKSPKSSNFYLSNRDRYILSKKDTEMFKLYLRGIQNMKRRLEGKIPISKNLPVIYSRRYYL